MQTLARTLTAMFVILLVAIFMGQPAQAAKACRELDSKTACERRDDCTWVKGYKRKDGVKVDPYCRMKGGKNSSGKKKSDKGSKNKDAKADRKTDKGSKNKKKSKNTSSRSDKTDDKTKNKKKSGKKENKDKKPKNTSKSKKKKSSTKKDNKK